MKRLLFLLLVAGVIVQGCTKTVNVVATTHQGVVIYNVCGNVVVQSIGPDYIGQSSWTDANSADKPVYNHVFKVANPCQFGQHSYGDTISFQIVAQQPQSCMQCQVYLATPDVAYPIHVE